MVQLLESEIFFSFRSWNSIAAKNPREIELILNRPAPFGNRIRDFAKHVPKYKIEIQGIGADEVIRKFRTILDILLKTRISKFYKLLAPV